MSKLGGISKAAVLIALTQGVILGLALRAMSATPAVSGPSLLAAPSDLYFSQQWALHNDGSQIVMIDKDSLHTFQQQGVSGVDIGWLNARADMARLALAPVTVAVIDSGIDPTHPDLAKRISSDGYDFLKKSSTLSDTVGHGTHVSGIIAANSDNQVGISGITPSTVKILPLRVLSDDFKNFSYNGKYISDYVADAVRYAVAHQASVINLSLGWPKIVDTQNARQAFAEAVQAGVLIVAAAGNDRKNQPTFPCSYDGVVCVGSVTNNGNLAVYSDFGGSVDILAPGDGVVSLYPTQLDSQTLRIQGYEMLSGTSQAAPQVAGIAAVLKSMNPQMSVNELKARLLSSTSALPSLPKNVNAGNSGAALYGLVNLPQAMNAQPKIVYLPNFKSSDGIVVNESNLQAKSSLTFQNLWATARNVKAKVLVNGVSAGSITAPSLTAGQTLTVPWTYQFSSLDQSSDLHLQLVVADASGTSRTFEGDFNAVRAMDQMPGSSAAVSAPSGTSLDWISTTNGHLFTKLTVVSNYATKFGAPAYYQQLAGSGSNASALEIFDSSSVSSGFGNSAPSIQVVQLPSIARVIEVMRLPINEDGTQAWVITGADSSKSNFIFYFLNSALQPLWRTQAASTWITPFSNGHYFSTANSWVKSNGKLIPCFMSQGILPAPDNFDEFDPRHSKADSHLFYLVPDAAPTGNAVKLTLRALDNAVFRTQYPNVHLQNFVPGSYDDQKAGHLRLLASLGTDLDAQTLIWDVASITQAKATASSGWDALSSSGAVLSSISLGGQTLSASYLSYFDETRASLTWSDTSGSFLERTEFSYESLENPIDHFTGAFDLGPLRRSWFLESNFDLVAFYQAAGSTTPQMVTVPLERDSTFPGEQFSEMLAAVLVGTTAHPLSGVYVDSSLVRGNQVSVAALDPATGIFITPLRYSLQIPTGCAQMDPAYLSAQTESFSVPIFCQQSAGMQFKLVQPNGT